ncbi:hypothetical protein [Streptomyces viridochromogenes]|uniref:Uncharacterized protein n=1 Tax=Streptomyces viridochromogenes Tue57 TaxID=1160705 RepID=L8P5I7_STRVR|nr:hypothetical protein [Streptomyces viridochromogenes]ELS51459.1 hypothetical protein STVIR_7477 [Streptomyces viridochromogenes Tue57]
MVDADAIEYRHDDEAASATAWAGRPTPDEWAGLIAEWDEIRQGYHLGDTPGRVLECARNVEASVAAGGPDTALWTLGPVLIGPYVIYARPDAAAEARGLKAMSAVERALPDEDSGNWFEGRMTRETWACPRNLAGFARAFVE